MPGDSPTRRSSPSGQDSDSPAVSTAGVQYSPTGSPRITIYKTPFRDGILEDYASKRAFLRIYGEITGRGTEPVAHGRRSGTHGRRGRPGSRETFATVGRTLGEALRARILEERIECLLLGGQISRSYIHLEPGLRKRPAMEQNACGASLRQPYRTRRLLRAARPYRRFADGSLTPPGRGEFPASRRSGDSADHRTNQMHNL